MICLLCVVREQESRQERQQEQGEWAQKRNRGRGIEREIMREVCWQRQEGEEICMQGLTLAH